MASDSSFREHILADAVLAGIPAGFMMLAAIVGGYRRSERASFLRQQRGTLTVRVRELSLEPSQPLEPRELQPGYVEAAVVS